MTDSPSIAPTGADGLESEPTEIGDQTLVAGVRPVTLADRLALRAAAPMQPRRNPDAAQRPCDQGLFDEVSRAQTDLVDMLRTLPNGGKP